MVWGSILPMHMDKGIFKGIGGKPNQANLYLLWRSYKI